MIRRNIVNTPYRQFIPNESHIGEHLRTSDKVKRVLESFPVDSATTDSNYDACIPVYGAKTNENLVYYNINPFMHKREKPLTENDEKPVLQEKGPETKSHLNPRRWLLEIVRLLQLSMMATTLVVYYIVYCYMQLIYFTLRSALYFHNADRTMKITIGLLMLTTIIFGFNVIIKIYKLVGLLY